MRIKGVTRQRRLVSSDQFAPLSNEQFAAILGEIADLLEKRGVNPFRVRAYRRAAGTVRGLSESVWEIDRAEGVAGLMRLPGIGRSLARTLNQLAHSGRLPLWERLRNRDDSASLFTTVPEIGPKLAQRIRSKLGIETLAELEAAARDGRLAQVPGMGGKRVRAVRESLAGRFARCADPSGNRKNRSPNPSSECRQVPVAELLQIDTEYRRLARQNKLPLIAPRRFNPTAGAWLPILRTQRGQRKYTVMYSNTARAHELGTIHDWVVIYANDTRRSCWTVITANYGRLRGRRVVRGREAECKQYYDQQNSPAVQRQLWDVGK